MKLHKISLLSLFFSLSLISCQSLGNTPEVAIDAPTFFAVAKKAAAKTASSSSFGYELNADQIGFSLNLAAQGEKSSLFRNQKTEINWSNVLLQWATTGFGEGDTTRKASAVLSAKMAYSSVLQNDTTSESIGNNGTLDLNLGAYWEDQELYLYANHKFDGSFFSPYGNGNISTDTGPIYEKVSHPDDFPAAFYDTHDYESWFAEWEEQFETFSSSSLDSRYDGLMSAFTFCQQGEEYQMNFEVTNETKDAFFVSLGNLLANENVSETNSVDWKSISAATDFRSFRFQLALNQEGFVSFSFDIDVTASSPKPLPYIVNDDMSLYVSPSVALKAQGKAKFGYGVTPKDKPEGEYTEVMSPSLL